MRKSRFTEVQIIGMLKEQEASMPNSEVCRRHGLRRLSSFNWSTPYRYTVCASGKRFAPQNQLV